VVFPDLDVLIPLESNDDIPLGVSLAAKAVLQAQSATRRAEVEAAAGTWDGEVLKASKHTENLLQLDNGVKIPPKGWKCERCDLTTNLWLNLTDGAINCGRKFFDGSGGNNHAVDHYTDNKYPLAVKLGTITSDGKADVFSYAEDEMVIDPHLVKHLKHFGIEVSKMSKTDKSMVELEIDINQRANEWLTLTESGSKLEPVHGPGLTGMENLGNTCYMNSVMQVLFTLPSFREQYVNGAEEVFGRTRFEKAHADDFHHQMAKLGRGLCSGDYSVPPPEGSGDEDPGASSGIRPTIFKNMIGRGHSEFSTKQQQDAQEFYLHLLTVMERENRKVSKSEHAFKPLQFEVEDRHQCGITKKVKYMSRVEDYLPLAIPMDEAINKDEVAAFKNKKAEAEAKGQKLGPDEPVVRPRVPLEACLAKFCAEEVVDDFYSSAAKTKTVAHKTMRLKTFPDYLLIQLKKFDIGDNWVPYKLDVEVVMPDTIDLGSLHSAGGLRDGEEELPQEEDTPAAEAAPAIEPSPEIVTQLSAMGFSTDACKKAAFHTSNSGVEAAMNWMMEHMDDPDLNTPFVNPSSKAKAAAAFVPDQDAMGNLMAMSFSEAQARKALKNTQNNVERAVDWIFSHPDDLGGDDEPEQQAVDPSASSAGGTLQNLTDGAPNYRLKAFISHMGNSHLVGHYVAHIHVEGKGWVIFNDEKVALSEKPPKGMGYLYLYQRV